ncbi:hypothetical protein Tco_0704135 [Tanacetum coccineum]|uniref:Uncharacterized protein n=1 Tax=Tanacetum coccineum TaxID=301880 RepID=A0ABQ4Y0X8_9ASTR
MRINPTLLQKEETYQVILDIIKNSTCYNAFLITADVLEIYMQQFWYTVKKIKNSTPYEFDLADVKVLRKILDICLRVQGEEFVETPSEESLLTFLIELGYKGQLNKLLSITGKDFQEYGQAIPYTMLTEEIKRLETYQTFLAMSTGLIPPKKTRDVALELGKLISKMEADIAEEARRVHETHEHLVIENPTGVDESDESNGEPANRPTRRRRPYGVTFRDTSSVSKKKSLERKEAFRIQQLTGDSSEGDGITPEVLEVLIGKTSSEGVEDDSYQSDEEDVNVDDITWLSTDEEEKAKGDDDDRSIDIEETDDERTDSENGDQAMTDAEKNVAEKVEEEKGDEEEERADDDQAQEDQVEDDICHTPLEEETRDTT